MSRKLQGISFSQDACLGGHASTCTVLIQQGKADLQDRSPSTGFVALHEAALGGFEECVRTLLEFGAPLHPRAIEGDTPRDLALRFGQMHVVELIDNYPVPPPRFPPSMWLHEHLDRKVR